MYRTTATGQPADPALLGAVSGPASAPKHAGPAVTPAMVRRLYVGAIFGSGAALFAASMLSGSLTNPFGILFIVALVAVTEGFGTRLYSDGHISVSFMGVIIAALAFGPAGAALAATTVAVVGFLAQEKSLTKLLFNFGQHNIAAFLAAEGAFALNADPSRHLLWAVGLGTLLGAVLFTLTSTAVTLAISLSSGRSIASIYRQSFTWMLPHYIGLGGVAGGLAYVYQVAGLAVALILAVPLVLSRWSTRQVIEKTRDTVSALERTNAELLEANAANRAILQAIPDVLFRLGDRRTGSGILRGLRDGEPGESPPLPPNAATILPQMALAAEGTGQAQLHEYRTTSESGDPRYFEARVVPTRDGDPLLMVRDISDRKRAENAQRLSGELRRTVTSNTPLLLFAANSEGIVQLIEGQGLELAGLDARPLVGKPLADALGEGVFVDEALAMVRSGRVVNTSAEIGGRIIELHLSPASGAEGEVGVVGVGLDVTDRRRVEEAMVQAQKLESLGVMAGGIAHDFNNLLTGILGNADLALSELPADAPAASTVSQIKLAGQRAAELAQQMLAYSGKGRLAVEPIEPGALVEETSTLLRSSIDRHISLEIETESNLPLVEADATQIRQVVMNLVINASDAIGDAGGLIRISTRKVSVSRQQLTETYGAPDLDAGDYVCIEVAANGSGMDPETMDRIFDPFFTTKTTGHGLGLAGALGITRSHSGAIKVESEPGKGTTFTILLPALGSGARARPAPRKGTATWKGSGTFLVIDDDHTVRTLVVRAARQFGLDAIEAPDGVAGLEQYEANAAAIDCVLLDMTMPRMNGAETLARIRESNPEARVILMSGYAEDETAARALGQVPTAFMHKPFSLDRLRDTLRDAFPAGAARDERAA